MMYNNWSMMNLGGGWGFWFIPLILWSLFWKAWALWMAARRGEKIWFGAILIINTMGILEIIYLFVFCKVRLGGCCKGGCKCGKEDCKCKEGADKGCACKDDCCKVEPPKTV